MILRDGDILSVIYNATVDGWVGDNAWTFIGKVSEEKKKLLRVTEKCMWAGLDAARAGNHLGDGHAIQSIAEGRALALYAITEAMALVAICMRARIFPTMGFVTGGSLRVGMVLAIEPMINAGTRINSLPCLTDGFVCTKDGKPSKAHFEKTVAITEDGPVVLTTEPDFERPVSTESE